MKYYYLDLLKPKIYLKSNRFISKEEVKRLFCTYNKSKLNGNFFNFFSSNVPVLSHYDTFYLYKNLVIASCSPFVNVKKPTRIYEFYN